MRDKTEIDSKIFSYIDNLPPDTYFTTSEIAQATKLNYVSVLQRMEFLHLFMKFNLEFVIRKVESTKGNRTIVQEGITIIKRKHPDTIIPSMQEDMQKIKELIIKLNKRR